jgi:uroporphyrinogen-III synthase
MTSVLLTRPRASSDSLAGHLQDLGYHPVIEPLLTIIPTAIPKPALQPIQAVMITSQNTLTVLDAPREDGLFALPCFCVGSRTAARARAFGFHTVFDTADDGIALAHLVTDTLQDKSKAILHLAGWDIDSKAQDALMNRGYTVLSWPLYKAIPATALTEQTSNDLKIKPLMQPSFFPYGQLRS